VGVSLGIVWGNEKMEHFTIDTSINISVVFALLTALFGAGRFTQKILVSLRAIERIAVSVETMEKRIDRLEGRSNAARHLSALDFETVEGDLFK
jgi:hypothetical protein